MNRDYLALRAEFRRGIREYWKAADSVFKTTAIDHSATLRVEIAKNSLRFAASRANGAHV
jgi:hypothetical protein